ncbi:MAG: MotA/TolQ/ExbB proton channel family protein [Aeriscardovia sp.]|nr:MotA/TolQ/ExbB proton channel family protein [Aeriscardovia sp.]
MEDMSAFFTKLFVNLFTTSDIIILFFAAFTVIVWLFANNAKNEVEHHLFKNHRRASKIEEDINEVSNAELENDLQPKIMKLNKWYMVLSNSISVFPLLGMLGTVKSLIGLATGMGDQSNVLEIDMFFSALTSTAWGIIFAMFFKLLTSGLAAKVESYNKEYEIIATRVTGS